MQVIVSKASGVERLQDLAGKRVYLGKNESGNRTIALEMLESVGIESTAPERMRSGTENDSYQDTSRKLIEGSLDAAFFLGGTPVAAVNSAMATGRFELLDLSFDMDALQSDSSAFWAKYDTVTVLAYTYDNQPDAAETIATTAYLMAREDLEDDVVRKTLGALYTDLPKLLLKHARAEDIRAQRPDMGTSGVELHDGVDQFWNEQEKKVLILTGSLTGAYYQTGVQVRRRLARDGIDAWVAHTDGSLENLRRLAAGWSGGVIALMQYDVVRWALDGGTESTYGISPEELPDFPTFESREEQDLRLIANVGKETTHVVIRKDALGAREQTVEALEGLRVSLGPEGSGTSLLARVILGRHEIKVTERPMAVETMVAHLRAGQIEAGFFTEAVPSPALKGLLDDTNFKLLSVIPSKMPMLGPVLQIETLSAGTYRSQLEDEGPVTTISTTGVVVAFEDLRDVYQITRAIALVRGLPATSAGPDPFDQFYPLQLHPDAEEYYQDRVFLPLPPQKLFGLFEVERMLDPLRVVGQILLILAILFGGYRGVLKMKRDMTAREVGKRVFAISVEATESASVRKLLDIRREIRDMAKRRRWQAGEINTDRWRVLEDVVNDGIQDAKQHLERALITEIRKPPPQVQDDHEAGRDYYSNVRERIWKHLENGELDAVQHARLLEILSGSLAEV